MKNIWSIVSIALGIVSLLVENKSAEAERSEIISEVTKEVMKKIGENK